MTGGPSDSSSLQPGAQSIAARTDLLSAELEQLLGSPPIPFDAGCHAALPEAHGIYRIFDPSSPDQTIRAGRTSTAGGGLRQRVYGNHLMGNQAGNLRAQLVKGAMCTDSEAAKRYIRERLVVQILAVANDRDRASLEHFMLAVLQPRYCD